MLKSYSERQIITKVQNVHKSLSKCTDVCDGTQCKTQSKMEQCF